MYEEDEGWILSGDIKNGFSWDMLIIESFGRVDYMSSRYSEWTRWFNDNVSKLEGIFYCFSDGKHKAKVIDKRNGYKESEWND